MVHQKNKFNTLLHLLLLLLMHVCCSTDTIKSLTCEETNQLLLERLERLERIFNVTQFNPDLDDISILELTFVNIKETAIKLIPKTDSTCSFNWIIGRCQPKCTCGFQPQFGDYNPSRACRLLDYTDVDPSCNASIEDKPWILKITKKLRDTAKSIKTSIAEHAPITDAECTWNWRQFKCYPEKECVLNYQLGDYSLDRSCRIRTDDEYYDYLASAYGSNLLDYTEETVDDDEAEDVVHEEGEEVVGEDAEEVVDDEGEEVVEADENHESSDTYTNEEDGIAEEVSEVAIDERSTDDERVVEVEDAGAADTYDADSNDVQSGDDVWHYSDAAADTETSFVAGDDSSTDDGNDDSSDDSELD